MADDWHPTMKARNDINANSDNHVVMTVPGDEHHPYNYSASDERDDRAMGPWKKVDNCSGPAGPDGEALHHFDDGPGVWRQT